MYISLGGTGPQFTNRLFNTIEVKPNSYVCLTNFSVKKNELVILDEDLLYFFYQDYANIFQYPVLAGSYNIYELANAFNNTFQLEPMKRFNLVASILPEDGEKLLFAIKVENNPIPLLDFGIVPEDDTGKPFDTLYNRTFGPGNTVDCSGRATWKDTGAAISTESYVCIPSDQTQIPKLDDGKQLLAMTPFLTTSAPIYVNKNLGGTPMTGYESQDTTVNLVSQAVIQATGQKYEDQNLPIQQQNNNKPELAANFKQADIMRFESYTGWVAGAVATKDVVLCIGGETLTAGSTSTDLITDLSDINDQGKNLDKRLWIRWLDPRDASNKQQLLLGWWSYNVTTGTKTWTVAAPKLVGKNEERFALEGNKFSMTMDANEEAEAPGSLYHARVAVDTLTYKSPSITKDIFGHTICFWDMDESITTPDTFWFNTNHQQTEGRFKDSQYLHNQYKFLWNNVGQFHSGTASSGHLWGSTIGRDSNYPDNADEGVGFELRCGSGSIDWGQQTFPNTPGYYNTGYNVSKSFNSTATGYKNAFYKFPDMWGKTLNKPIPGIASSLPEGTVLPATMSVRTIGSYYMSICFRLDDITEPLYQIIYAYQGSDTASGVATDPHTMLGVKIGSDKLLVSDGGPASTDRDEVDVTKQSDGTPYTFAVNKWINIAIVFQNSAGPTASQWEIVGIDEDGEKFIANPTIGKTPTKPLYGIGGNDKCNGSQTVSSGLVGSIKLFKIGYLFGDDLTGAYDAGELVDICCADMAGHKTNGNLSDWDYSKDFETLDLIDDDQFTESMWGIGCPDFDQPLTVIMGNTVHSDNKISNYNPYDSLFTAAIWRNATDGTTQEPRVVGPEFEKYLQSGTIPMQNQCGLVNNSNPSSFLKRAGYLANEHYPLPINTLDNKDVGDILAEDPIDTEIGLNDNRIHIDNLPIQSFNGNVGMMDRCIYQTGSVLPVREIGSNFVNNSMSVPQKVWCPLNNAGSLHLNQFDVKITDLEDKLDKEIISSQLNIEIKDEKELIISK